MGDMSKTITPKSDQLNADDLIGGEIIITVTKANVVEGKSDEQPASIFFEGDNGKPYKPCKSMRRVLVQCWGKDSKQYVGRSMKLYRDPTVKFGGMDVGGIRISHLSHIEKPITMALTATKASRKPYTVKPLTDVPQQSKPASVDPQVKSDGDNAASNGVEAYTNWLASLDPEKKETVRSLHSNWSKIARAADEANQPKEEEEVPFGEDDETPAM